ncbi:hypothetical protein ACTXT7_012072 [Hymenolepis weldensis]
MAALSASSKSKCERRNATIDIPVRLLPTDVMVAVTKTLAELSSHIREGPLFKYRFGLWSSSQLAQAFLQGYLRLVSLLPDDILGVYASEALEPAVLGVVGEAGRSIGPRTRALSLKVIARMAAAQRSSSSFNTSTPLLLSPDAADDFLAKLAALRLTCAAADPSHPSTSSLRFNLARCLRFLVDLPPSVTSRHRSNVSRLLEDLLDDDCQSVRLEAAQANNEWCLKV